MDAFAGTDDDPVSKVRAKDAVDVIPGQVSKESGKVVAVPIDLL